MNDFIFFIFNILYILFSVFKEKKKKITQNIRCVCVVVCDVTNHRAVLSIVFHLGLFGVERYIGGNGERGNGKELKTKSEYNIQRAISYGK